MSTPGPGYFAPPPPHQNEKESIKKNIKIKVKENKTAINRCRCMKHIISRTKSDHDK
jgi:hypothetical protein